MMKNCLVLVLLMTILNGCEKKIDLSLKEGPDKLVVDGSIENGQPPLVVLTRSVGYFSNLTPELLEGSFVHGAQVFVSNGLLIQQLKEYSVPVGPQLGVFYYYYTSDPSNPANAFVGDTAHAYTLRIVSEGKEYTATTTIPRPTKKIDSLWWKPVPHSTDTTKAVVMARVTDPPGFGDYIRYYTKTSKGSTYYPPLNSVFDDLFIDGTTYDVQLQPGFNRNADSSEKDFFFRGDTVNFKISNIDKATYDFWRTWEFSYSSVGNPFSTPTKVLGNISNGALGYFGGYASQYGTLIIPR
ncbi:MAG: DUF4249 domain-containing protein [Flavisolibacter sp.]